ncbi:SGNH/GDSL hydrolase family protein [Planctomycetota bacterium]
MAAICLGLGAVLVVEAVFRLSGVGLVSDPGDPFVGFSEEIPLFVLSKDETRYEIAKSRQRFFQPDSFEAKKNESEFRIFCLGGSTVQGRPYSIETSFTTWLELNLKAADATRDWEVINCGGVSYASYRLIPIMKEVVQHSPDLFVIYTGHNEFLEDRTYGKIKRQPIWLKSIHERLIKWRIYNVANSLFKAEPDSSPKANLPAEVDALLDYQGGLAKYHRDDVWRDGVVRHYEHNLRRMVRIARQAAVPIVFVNPVSNVRDTPPFKVERPVSMSDQDYQEFQSRWEAAKAAPWEDLNAKANMIRETLALDSRHAEARFLFAKVYEEMGDAESAKTEYLRAKDEDICPLRMLESMHVILTQVTRQTGVPLVDVRSVFEREAERGIPGNDQLIDHVHPRIEGHQRIARELLDFMIRTKRLSAQKEWEVRAQALYQKNYDLLPDSYFPKSQARLRGLQAWTKGRVTRLRIEQKNAPK